MCLETMQEKVESWKVGYKVFKMLASGECEGEFKAKEKPRPIGKWINARDYGMAKVIYLPIGAFPDHYPPGWHVFKLRLSAECWANIGQTVSKVKCRGAVATGTTTFKNKEMKTGVFREIYIIPEEVK